MVAVKLFSGTRVRSKPSLRICALGYRKELIVAVIGSISTPTILASGGARPMNVPAPQPGSSTRPPAKPASRRASHSEAAISGSV
jgi:hypothetical protein